MDNNNIEIRCAKNVDIEALCKFEREARLTEPDIWGWDFNEAQYKEKLLALNIEAMDNTKIILAIQNDKVIGRCDIAILFSLVDFEKTGYVDWIYTLLDHRGNSIGKKLLQGAESYFQKNKVKNYYLFTASNEQAKEFYHRQNDLKFSNKEIAEKDID